MKRTAYLLAAVLIYSISQVVAQDYQSIDLKNPQHTAPEIAYYVLDVLDGRKVQNLIGMVRPGGKGEIKMLTFTDGFRSELKGYFKTAYPVGAGKSPVIISIKKLWVKEKNEEGADYSECEISMDFLTPKQQVFHSVTQTEQLKTSDDFKAHKEVIVITLNECMEALLDDGTQDQYFEMLNSDEEVIDDMPTQTVTTQPVEGGVITSSPQYAKAYAASKTRIAFQGGYTYRLAEIPKNIDAQSKEFIRKLKSGYHLGMDLILFWDDLNGLGFSGTYSRASSTLNDVPVEDEMGNVFYGDMTDAVNLYYFGLTYFNRALGANNASYFYYSMTAGYYGYAEELDMDSFGLNMEATGQTLGFGMSLGWDFLTSENFALGLQGSVLMGWLNKMEVDGQEYELEESENLSRIDLTLGIRFLP